MTRPEELDALGRRLRAALAAVLARENTPEQSQAPYIIGVMVPRGCLEGRSYARD